MVDPELGLAVEMRRMEERNFLRKSLCGLATDLILGNRGMIPLAIYRPLSKACSTHDFASDLYSNPCLEGKEYSG